MKFQIKDEELGVIHVQRRHNAKRFNFRCAADGIHVSMPIDATKKEDRKSVVQGKSVSVRVDHGGCRAQQQ